MAERQNPQFTVRRSFGVEILMVRHWDWPLERWREWRNADYGDLPEFHRQLEQGRPSTLTGGR